MLMTRTAATLFIVRDAQLQEAYVTLRPQSIGDKDRSQQAVNAHEDGVESIHVEVRPTRVDLQ